jgi:ATP-binding cassette subfamily F protein uup
MSAPATLLSCQSLAKSYGTRFLFRNITFGIAAGERAGLIGPNGSGKSTLLKILAGQETPDDGAVSRRSGLVVGYVPQEDVFAPGATVQSTLTDAVAGTGLAADPDERDRRIARLLDRLGFADPEQAADTLSGGWKKRLSLARELIRAPDLLFLDEPTNHLDLEGVLWLERFLNQEADFAYLVVSHDRTFLENVARRTIELNALYADGYLSVDGPYSEFIVKREEYYAAQQHRQAALETVLKREVEWLRRGAQARSTKAKGRIDAAGQLMQDVATLKQRNAAGAASGPGIDFTASGRRTKELLAGKGLAAERGGRTLFSGLDLLLTPGTKLGLLGPNGSGKTTLLRLLTGEAEPDAGTVRRAEQLNVVWFDQNREQLDRTKSLKDSLSPNSDTVTYRGSSMHLSAWAKRFGFKADQMNTPISYLSGGEQARILIARLMLRPADILILDEPTNDLDIPTLEVLEENLRDFPGAMVLVTHDRYLLDTVSTEVLALDGDGGARFFAGYDQWETWYEAHEAASAAAAVPAKSAPTAPAAPRGAGLSSSERRELQQMEAKIEKAEARVGELEAQMVEPAVATDAAKLQETWTALEQAKAEVERLYARWEDLEARQNR